MSNNTTGLCSVCETPQPTKRQGKKHGQVILGHKHPDGGRCGGSGLSPRFTLPRGDRAKLER
jgi:hypothetical protein